MNKIYLKLDQLYTASFSAASASSDFFRYKRLEKYVQLINRRFHLIERKKLEFSNVAMLYGV